MKRWQQAGLTALLLGMAGCSSTGSLGGTSWTVVEVLATEETDIVDMDVAFGTDGWMSVNTTYADGRTEAARRAYSVHEDTLLVVKRPQGDLPILKRVEGDEMIITAETFHARLLRMN